MEPLIYPRSFEKQTKKLKVTKFPNLTLKGELLLPNYPKMQPYTLSGTHFRAYDVRDVVLIFTGYRKNKPTYNTPPPPCMPTLQEKRFYSHVLSKKISKKPPPSPQSIWNWSV